MGEHKRRKDNLKTNGKLPCLGWCVSKLVTLLSVDRPLSVVVRTHLSRTLIGTRLSAGVVKLTLNTTMMSSSTPDFALRMYGPILIQTPS